MPAQAAGEVWERIRTKGRSQGLLERGFDVAHSLRLESGYILFSQEFQELDEAATRRSRLLRHHELFCTFIPLMPRGLILQYFVRINQHDDNKQRRAL